MDFGNRTNACMKLAGELVEKDPELAKATHLQRYEAILVLIGPDIFSKPAKFIGVAGARSILESNRKTKAPQGVQPGLHRSPAAVLECSHLERLYQLVADESP